MTPGRRDGRPVLPLGLFAPQLVGVVAAAGLWFTAGTTHERITLGVLVVLAVAVTAPLAFVAAIRRVPGVWANTPVERTGPGVVRAVRTSIGATVCVLGGRYLVTGSDDTGGWLPGLGGMLAGTSLFLAACAWWFVRPARDDPGTADRSHRR
ncbi:hypothetical protein [Nakamurella deserti]|uniref:hypothetical protein n=1 Tax=Nakamurella deserti TaxID=2164074 RepID=UPI000DBE7904|nr:hypothetical protein [Nakamurella deserti]